MADNKKRYIAIDLGASGGKVVLATVGGGQADIETLHSFSLPEIRIGGQAYWDIYAAYSGILKGLSAAGLRKVPVESIGIDSWGPGIACVAKDGHLLGLPRLSGEVLSDAVQAKFFKRMERRELYEATGVNVLDSHAALQLFGLRREKSVALDEAKYLFFIPEAIGYLLTGKRYTEFTSLSTAGLADRRTGKISKDVLGACKVRARRFPSVVQPGAKLGKLSEEVAQATGLGRVQVVAVAGHDLASAVAVLPDDIAVHSPASQGVSSSDSSSKASAFLRIGAVSELGVVTASPMVNDQTFEMNFSNEAGVGGTNLLVKRIVGTDLLERCVEAWRAAGRDYGPEDLVRMAREGAPTAAQLDPEDPALRSASNAPAAITRYCSLRNMAAPTDDAAIVRLICTSVAEKIGDSFVKLQSVTPFRLRSLCLLGSAHSGFFSLPGYQAPSASQALSDSASQSAPDPASSPESLESVFYQMVADECAVPVTFVPVDAAILGNILVQSGVGQPGLTPQALAATYTPVTYTPGLV